MCAPQLSLAKPLPTHAWRLTQRIAATTRTRTLYSDGMLIYKLLGDNAEESFARSWGTSYGVGAASEWKVSGRRCVCSVTQHGRMDAC